MTSLQHDERGQSITYLIAGCTIVISAGLIMIFGDGFTDLLTFAGTQCQTQACNDGVDNVQAVWDWFPLVVVGMVFIMIISASIFQSRRPTR